VAEPLPAPAAAAVAFDERRGRAVVACLNGEIVSLQHTVNALAPQQDAERQQEADRLPHKRRRVAALDEQAADVPLGLRKPPQAQAAGIRPEPRAVRCIRRFSMADARAAASGAAAASSPVFGRPAVDAATGIVACATVAGEVVALSAGEDRIADIYPLPLVLLCVCAMVCGWLLVYSSVALSW
jgi:hypothetical protein